VNGEKREFESIGDADLVVNVAQIILYDLLGGSELIRDLFVLEALNDERDDLEFLGRETIADTGSDEVIAFRSCGDWSAGIVQIALAVGNGAYATEEVIAGDGAEGDAVDSDAGVALDVLAIFGDHDHPGLELISDRDDGL